jgi:protein-disulfide isomerase
MRIQVFVTPACPYCTQAAMLAQQFAMENPLIRTDIIEVTEFPHLGQKYSVMGVPKVVINETHGFEGAMPENAFVEELINAVKEE